MTWKRSEERLFEEEEYAGQSEEEKEGFEKREWIQDRDGRSVLNVPQKAEAS